MKYIGFYEGQKYEIDAVGLWPAKQAAMAAARQDNPRHGDKRIAAGVSVMLAQRDDGSDVIHHPGELP